MEALIIHCHTIFDELSTASHASSPPLPPAPLGETISPYAYGSTHTKFSESGSQHHFDAPLPQTPTPQTTGDDFTPQLPSQPPASIHPSSRGNNGSSNGHSNTSPVQAEEETNIQSPTSFISSPPLPLRPGKQSSLTTIQSLRGTRGLDFSQSETSEGGWDGSPPASPPSSDPPSPPSAFKSPQIPSTPPPSTLRSTSAHQQHQPVLTHTLTQDQPPLPEIERRAVGGLESIATPFETPLSSSVDDSGHSSHLTPNPPGGPTLQLVTSRPLTQQVHQLPTQVNKAPDRSPIHPLSQPEEVPQGGNESQE